MRKNIISKLDLNPYSNPNKIYKILHTILEHAKETPMSSKTIKFNKRKHKTEQKYYLDVYNNILKKSI